MVKNTNKNFESDELFQSLVESNPQIIFSLSPEGDLTYLNPAFEAITKWSVSGWLGKPFKDLISQSDHGNAEELLVRVLSGEGISSYELNILTEDGGFITADVSARPQYLDGEVSAILCTARDITKFKLAEVQIHKSLKEKESLLKEIHHRVKNNLQVISSLLSLQSDYVKDGDSLMLFNESQNRISTIALVHEQLYQSSNLAEINMESYIRNLTNNLLSIFENVERRIDVKVNSDNIGVNIDAAIPCGLIINELFSNSMKHAFSNLQSNGDNEKTNEIIVDFHSQTDGEMELMVCDNGVGLSKDINIRETDSLGLQLVCALTEQLKGKIDVEIEEGTKFKVTFPDVLN